MFKRCSVGFLKGGVGALGMIAIGVEYLGTYIEPSSSLL